MSIFDKRHEITILDLDGAISSVLASSTFDGVKKRLTMIVNPTVIEEPIHYEITRKGEEEEEDIFRRRSLVAAIEAYNRI